MEFIVVFALLFILELVYFKVANRLNIFDKPNERSSHTQITLRGGGVVFYLGVLLFFIYTKGTYPWFFGGLTLIALISFIDDVHSVSPKLRLAVHFSSLLMLFYGIGLLTLPWWGIILALIVAVGIINAYNFMDGINGITGGYSLILFIGFLYVNQFIQSFVHPYFLYFMIAALLVFNFFNFRVKARCFAGDVGSVGIAFIILFLLGRLIWLTQDVRWIVFLVVYGVDSVLTIIHRLLLKENISEPHRKHAYQLLANELKWNHLSVSLLYMGIQAVVLVGYFLMPTSMQTLYLLLSIVVLSLFYFFFMKKYFNLHKG